MHDIALLLSPACSSGSVKPGCFRSRHHVTLRGPPQSWQALGGPQACDILCEVHPGGTVRSLRLM